jgi:predicted DNA-binding helix-hairpin-helix protein
MRKWRLRATREFVHYCWGLDNLNLRSYNENMLDTREKLAALGYAARFDDCTHRSSDVVAEGRGFFTPESADAPVSPNVLPCVSHVTTPWGQSKAILKVLQTSACQNDCFYCAFRAGRNVRRAHLSPDELARSFDMMHRAGLVEGIFLSSGVLGTTRTMDEMLATAELVREKYSFRGYMHLKLLPAVTGAHVERAVQLADRVSVNLEAPTPSALASLAPRKSLGELIAPLREASRLVRRLAEDPERRHWRRVAGDVGGGEYGGGRLGLSTQFVVGPGAETDRELLGMVQYLYRDLRLARAYYSAFTPVSQTPLEEHTPTDPAREFRLYQADWLLRYYDFSAEELALDGQGQLNLAVDPKTAWALAHPERFPIEINQAPLRELLRVPGIGPRSARAILAGRRLAPLREAGDLRKLGARADHAAPYITLAGRRPPHQPSLPLEI